MAKTALITGANRGLGLALAQVFQPHYSLVLHSRRHDVALMERFPDASFLVGDLLDPTNFSKWAVELEGVGLSVLVNNAGVYLNRGMMGLTDRDLFDAVRINLVAPILMARMAWPLLEENAVVVNISSLAAKSPGPGEAVYAATKAGLSAFSGGLQYDATERNVRVVDVRLGAMKTAMAVNREGWHNFIDPVEAAGVVLAVCQDYGSLRPTCIEVKRRRY